MRRLILLATAASALAVGGVSAPEARSLSCIAHPDATPASILAGTEQMAGGEPFFTTYDLAIIGTPVARGEVTNPTSGAPHPTITFRVDAAFGVSEIGQTIVVTTGDPRIAGNVSFNDSQTWFVPLKATTASGLTNFVFPCDPTPPVDRAEIPSLLAGVAPTIPVALPGGAPPPPPPPPPAEGAMIALAKVAPATRRAGGLTTYRMTVTNTGGPRGDRVTLVDRLPEGLVPIRRRVTHPRVRAPWARYRAALRSYRSTSGDAKRSAYRRMIARRSQMRRVRFGTAYLSRSRGRVLTFNLGRVRPGASKTVAVTLRITKRAPSNIENAALATAESGSSARASARTRIVGASSTSP